MKVWRMDGISHQANPNTAQIELIIKLYTDNNKLSMYLCVCVCTLHGLYTLNSATKLQHSNTTKMYNSTSIT